MNIFEQLNSQNIPYCVVVSKVKLKKCKLDISSWEYSIIAKRSDIPKRVMGFKNEHTKEGIVYRELNRQEINDFRDIIDEDFKLVINEPHGRLYELNNKSFKLYFNNNIIGNNINIK